MGPHSIFPIADANLFSLTCELLQGNKMSSDNWNNIVVKFSNGNIILDCHIKTHEDLVARVEFLQVMCQERAQSATALHKKKIDDLHVELGHSLEVIIHATAKALGTKSPVPSNQVKIVPLEGPKLVEQAKMLL